MFDRGCDGIIVKVRGRLTRVKFSTMCVPEIYLRSSALMENFFNHWGILSAPLFAFTIGDKLSIPETLILPCDSFKSM